MKATDFFLAIQGFGLNISTLRVEDILTLSMNNTLINLNCNGLTWAAKTLAPRTGSPISPEQFLGNKLRTLAVSEYLSDKFSRGIQMNNRERFFFDQRAEITDTESTRRFLRHQASEAPVVIDDRIRGNIFERPGKKVGDEFLVGPFFTQKGAPAKETLANGIEFAPIILKGLCALHKHTGLTRVLPLDGFVPAAEKVVSDFERAADSWTVNEDKPKDKIGKYEKLYNSEKRDTVSRFIKREVFLQTETANELLMDLILQAFNQEELGSDEYKAFGHGDSHGVNFIIVQYEYSIEGGKRLLLDREYLNEIFTSVPSLQKLSIEFPETRPGIVFRPFEPKDEQGEKCFVAYRFPTREVHLIDVDTGMGLNEDEKQPYVFDLVKLAISTVQWSHILPGHEYSLESAVSVYYDQFKLDAL